MKEQTAQEYDGAAARPADVRHRRARWWRVGMAVGALAAAATATAVAVGPATATRGHQPAAPAGHPAHSIVTHTYRGGPGASGQGLASLPDPPSLQTGSVDGPSATICTQVAGQAPDCQTYSGAAAEQKLAEGPPAGATTQQFP